MTLGEKQQYFVALEARWVLWCLEQPGWTLRHGEGRILQLGPDGTTGRRARLLMPQGNLVKGTIVKVKDLVHLSEGAHYMGTGADWQLFVDGEWISATDHPAWQQAGAKWRAMDPLCRWGGDFTKPDGNHISLEHDGKS